MRGQPRIRLPPVRRSMSTLLWKMWYKALLANFTVTSACATWKPRTEHFVTARHVRCLQCRPISSEAALSRASRNGKTRLSTPWSSSAAGNLIVTSGSSGFTSPAEIRHCMRIAAAAATGGGGAAVVALIGRCSTTCSVFSLHFLIPLSLSPHFCP